MSSQLLLNSLHNRELQILFKSLDIAEYPLSRSVVHQMASVSSRCLHVWADVSRPSRKGMHTPSLRDSVSHLTSNLIRSTSSTKPKITRSLLMVIRLGQSVGPSLRLAILSWLCSKTNMLLPSNRVRRQCEHRSCSRRRHKLVLRRRWRYRRWHLG
jgi:hypothetical protein